MSNLQITPQALNETVASDQSHNLALLQLGRRLQADEYNFITVTPLSHQRNNARDANRIARNLRDIFG